MFDLANVYQYYTDKKRPTPGELFYPEHIYKDSDDFIAKSRYTVYDLPNWLHIAFIVDWIEDDWAYEAETETDDEFDLTFEDLEQYYNFLKVNLNEEDLGRRTNRLLIPGKGREFTENRVSVNYGSNARLASTALCFSSGPNELLGPLSIDDFRFRY